LRLIVGLGNPGERYAPTRHNIGSQAVERAATRWSVTLKPAGPARQGSGTVRSSGPSGSHTDVTLAVPLAWMNESGPAVKALLDSLALVPDQVIVVHDDLDLPLGRLRIRRRGGPGGHNGILSIITALNTDEFCRLKLGVGRPPLGVDSADYVLAPFLSEERAEVERVVDQAVLALDCLVTEGTAAAMNRFNQKELTADDE
jgi:PTH1 family peptidyl-tRNA hydrolase